MLTPKFIELRGTINLIRLAAQSRDAGKCGAKYIRWSYVLRRGGYRQKS